MDAFRKIMDMVSSSSNFRGEGLPRGEASPDNDCKQNDRVDASSSDASVQTNERVKSSLDEDICIDRANDYPPDIESVRTESTKSSSGKKRESIGLKPKDDNTRMHNRKPPPSVATLKSAPTSATDMKRTSRKRKAATLMKDGTTFRITQKYRGELMSQEDRATLLKHRRMPFLKRTLVPLLCDNKHEIHTDDLDIILTTVVRKDLEGNHVVRTEARRDRCCPLCKFDTKSDQGLLRHCQRFHSDDCRIDSFRDDEDGMLHFYARSYDSEYTSDIGPGLLSSRLKDFSFHKFRPSRRKRRSFRKSDRNGSKRTGRQNHIVPFRKTFKLPTIPKPFVAEHKYVHAKSRMPINQNRIAGDDSDDESDEEWRGKFTEGALKDFLDVTEEEAVIENLWNRFIQSDDVVIADSMIPMKCFEFIRIQFDSLKGLRPLVVKHLLNLCERRLISIDHFTSAMKEFDDLQRLKID